ncbi:MAG: c-type cytochrome [Bacteroidota bacterium]
MAYEAYAFGPLLRRLLAEHDLDSNKAEVQFFCKDGYAPIQTCAEVLAGGGGYLAFRDLRQREGQVWPEGKEEEMSPFYLVWEQGAKVDKHLSWPFGLTEIELRSHSESYQRFFPTDQPELGEAYELYRVNCQKCHALDGNGGSMAPDFHAPKNLTEYWQRADIVAFAQAPQSYRRNSHMPPIKQLTEAQLHQVVDYLTYLAQKK